MSQNPYEASKIEPATEIRAKYANPIRDAFAVAAGILFLNVAVLVILPLLFPVVPVSPKIEALEAYCYISPILFGVVATVVGLAFNRYGWLSISALVLFGLFNTWLDFQILDIIKLAG